MEMSQVQVNTAASGVKITRPHEFQEIGLLRRSEAY